MIIQIIYNFKVGGEVSSWSVTERNGSSGEPMASRCWSGEKVALHELTEHPPLSLLKFLEVIPNCDFKFLGEIL